MKKNKEIKCTHKIHNCLLFVLRVLFVLKYYFSLKMLIRQFQNRFILYFSLFFPYPFLMIAAMIHNKDSQYNRIIQNSNGDRLY